MSSSRKVLSARTYKEIPLDFTEIRRDLRDKIKVYKETKSGMTISERKLLQAGVKIQISSRADFLKESGYIEDKFFSKKSESSKIASLPPIEKLSKPKNASDDELVSRIRTKREEINEKRRESSSDIANTCPDTVNSSTEFERVKFARKMKKLMTEVPKSVKPSKSIFQIRNDMKMSVDLHNINKTGRENKLYALSPRSDKTFKFLLNFASKQKNYRFEEAKFRLFLRQLVVSRSKIQRALEKNRTHKVIRNFMKILVVAIELDEVNEFTQILITLGHLLKDIGELDKSIYFYNEAVILHNHPIIKLTWSYISKRISCDLTRNFSLKLEVLIELANLAQKVKQFEYSLRLLKRALEYCWLVRKKEAEMRIYENMGQCYCFSGDMERAKYYHERGLGGHTEDLNSNSLILTLSKENMNNYVNSLVYNFDHFSDAFINNLHLPIDHMRKGGKKINSRAIPFRNKFKEIEKNFKYNFRNCTDVLRRVLQEQEFSIEIPTPRIGKRIKIEADSISPEVRTFIIKQRRNQFLKDKQIDAFYNSSNFKALKKKDREPDIDKYKYDMETRINLRLRGSRSNEETLSDLLKSIHADLKYKQSTRSNTVVKSRILINSVTSQSQEKAKSYSMRKISTILDVVFKNLISKYLKLNDINK